MIEILRWYGVFADTHYVLAFFMLMLVVVCIVMLIELPFKIANRFFRVLNIRKHGWPTAPIDADGDIVFPEKKS